MAYSKAKLTQFKNEILRRVIAGETVHKLCNDRTNKLPVEATVYSWLNEKHNKFDPKFLKAYTRAREQRADNIFEEILIIADSQENDVIDLPDGTQITNHNVINRNRLQIDARKWMLGKMQPQKYNDKIDITSNGEHINLTETDRVARIAALKEKLNGHREED